MMGNSSEEEGAGLPEEDPVFLRTRLTEVEALYAQVQVQFRELRTWYDKLKRQHRELLWSDVVLERVGLSEAAPGPAIADADRANGHIGAASCCGTTSAAARSPRSSRARTPTGAPAR